MNRDAEGGTCRQRKQKVRETNPSKATQPPLIGSTAKPAPRSSQGYGRTIVLAECGKPKGI